MRQSRFAHLKPRVLSLRREGLSYSEINQRLSCHIPQSTLSNWCSAISLSIDQSMRLRGKMVGSEYGRATSRLRAISIRKRRRLAVILEQAYLLAFLSQHECARLVLLALYLGEGAKREQGTVNFTNSNPGIIRLFLHLFRFCYVTDLSKFRITIHGRADQDVHLLERFWSDVIDMPDVRFYKTRIDPRTQGIPTRKPNYMGVCRIEYIDARIQFELVNVGSWICAQFIK
jgi:hypothetical protein